MISVVVGRFFTSKKRAKLFIKKHRPQLFITTPTAGGFLVMTPKALLSLSKSLKT